MHRSLWGDAWMGRNLWVGGLQPMDESIDHNLWMYVFEYVRMYVCMYVCMERCVCVWRGSLTCDGWTNEWMNERGINGWMDGWTKDIHHP